MSKKINQVLAFVLTIAALLTGQTAWADTTWSVENNTGSTFRIKRSTSGTTETVKYRTVNLSAYAGQHYTAKSGEVTFGPTDTYIDVTVTERTPAADAYAYKYQTGTKRKYRFDVTDLGGFHLAQCDREITTGTSFSGSYVNKSVTDLVYFQSGSVKSGSGNKYLDVAHSGTNGTEKKIDDGYDYNNNTLCTVSTDNLYGSNNSSLRTWLNSLSYKMYATVYFQQREVDDGYQYIQILADNASTYDGKDGDGKIDNGPTTSLYKAAFILTKNENVCTSWKYQAFPHKTDDHTSSTEFDYSDSYLYAQAFKSSSYRATTSGSLVLAPTVNDINVRFDANGSGDDTWYLKNLKVRMALVDTSAPTILSNSITVAPGRYSKGNTVYVSVAFNEIVTVTGTPKLTTTSNNHWGDLSYVAGSGSNVLTFSTTIPANATGSLNITGLTGTVEDLAGNSFTGSSVTATNLCSVDANYTYTITYNLDEGSVATANPTSYTYETDAITLTNPTRFGYYFNGWTGSNGNTPQTTVTIANHSHGNKSYTANWIKAWTGSGTQGDPYTITSWQGLDLLAQYVNSGNDCYYVYFQLGGNIEYTHTTNWNNSSSTENNYTAIGTDDHPFKGTFDGNNYTVSGIRIYKGGTSSADCGQGLFYNVSKGGTVKRINLSNARITGKNSVGGIVGNTFMATIEDCIVDADVCIHAKANSTTYHGGIVGNNQGTVQRCISHATISMTGTSVGCKDFGGIVGYNYNNGTIIDCIADGVIIPDTKGRGAIVGYMANGILTRNYYRGCNVASTENTTDVGKGNSDSSTETSDVATNQGALPLYAVTLPEHVSLVRNGTNLPGTGNATYTTGADIDGQSYAYATATLRLRYDAASLPSGYDLSSITVKYTSGSTVVDVTSNGDYTFDFTMPDADVTVTPNFLPLISYIDADGVEQSHMCTPITTSTSSTINYGDAANAEGWYCVNSDVTFDSQQIIFNDQQVNIILCDGATMSVQKTTQCPFNVNNGSLAIYGQALGTGTLTANSRNGRAISANANIDFNGGTIIATSSYSIGICADNNITIRRGNITANGGSLNDFCGIKASDTITLGCLTTLDRIYSTGYSGTVTIAEGQTLTDGNSANNYTGTLDDNQKDAIKRKTMMKALGDVSYIDENGLEQTCTNYIILSDNVFNGMTHNIGKTGYDTWYVASGNYTYNTTNLQTNGYVHLILCDGANFTVNGSSYGIEVGSVLSIYSQSQDTGTLTANVASASGRALFVSSGNLAINGGVINANGGAYGIYIDNGHLTVNRATINATGTTSDIHVDGTFTLGWTRLTDRIYTSSYNCEGTVSIKDGQTFWNGSEGLSGTITDMTKLNNKTLRPCFSITLPDGITASGVLGQDGTTAYALPEATVTLSSLAGYHLADVTVNGNAATDNGDGTWSFQMPATNITVTATIISGGYCGFASVNSGQNVIWAYNLSTTTLTISPNPEAIAGGETNFNMAGYDESNQPWNDYKDVLTTVVIDAGVTNIGSNAFYECSKLESITLPDGITSIGTGAFYDCQELSAITIPASVTTIDYCAFEDCYKLEAVTFAAGSLLTSIGSSAFSSCRKLSAITIPASVRNIDYNAFQECYNLKTVTFAASSQLTSIGSNAFSLCDSLSAITIPEHVTTIGDNAFAECPSLSTIIALPATPPSLGSPMGVPGNRNNHNIYFRNHSYWTVDGWRRCIEENSHDFFDHGYLLMDKEANDIAALYTALHDDDRYAALHNDDPEDDDLPYKDAPIDSIVNVMLYGRTLYKDGGWNTLCLPFDVKVGSGPLEDATAMTLDGSTSNFETSTGILTLNFTGVTSGNTITAGTPFIVKWESGEDLVNPNFRHVSFSNSTNDVTSADGRVQFKGTYSPIDYASNNQSILFLGTGNKLYYPQAGANIGSCRAYFQLNGSNEVKAFKLNFNEEDDNADGIGSIQNTKFKIQNGDAVYDLSGRKINSQFSTFNSQFKKKGIYIINGRKVLY
ncbi:MAG: leucine-rich repeat protein [Bacteroidaceae bacterium]|nr:leucine-rich repeat protein [Bacteroidaceae bacterium]